MEISDTLCVIFPPYTGLCVYKRRTHTYARTPVVQRTQRAATVWQRDDGLWRKRSRDRNSEQRGQVQKRTLAAINLAVTLGASESTRLLAAAANYRETITMRVYVVTSNVIIYLIISPWRSSYCGSWSLIAVVRRQIDDDRG